ncbi:MAG: hypothetical protein ALECFALPRED_010471 [Alectoria fallacina]|uniref:Uncharacterized protein n=1 Tax=Alectoria fallacina TaxID=1903189 RepID=A0A8H3ICT3_9LECA|nr:MAG: hypothetical protein ALECFALPRED_010471 [Alectoria fallacina]
MPTPESALFLAKKPRVPPTFQGVDYADTQRLKAAQDAIIREQWVKSMMARLVREELGKCYAKEGVNHLEKCGGLRGMSVDICTEEEVAEGTLGELEVPQAKWYIERYFEALKDAKIRGYLFQQQNYVPGDE